MKYVSKNSKYLDRVERVSLDVNLLKTTCKVVVMARSEEHNHGYLGPTPRQFSQRPFRHEHVFVLISWVSIYRLGDQQFPLRFIRCQRAWESICAHHIDVGFSHDDSVGM